MTVVEMVRLVSGDEFSSMTDEEINVWDEFVSPLVSKKQFGKLYDQAKALLICHKLKMAGYGGDESLGALGKIGNSFIASSVSDGGSSISFASGGVGNLATNAELGMTIYGIQYLQLMRMCVVPIHISGEDDLNGRL